MSLPAGKGHDVRWIRKDMPGARDEEIIERAMVDQRLLITFDKDFGELVFHRGKKAAAGIILFRVAQPSALAVTNTVLKVLESRNDWVGHFSVVDDRTVRMRSLS